MWSLKKDEEDKAEKKDEEDLYIVLFLFYTLCYTHRCFNLRPDTFLILFETIEGKLF
jgi:hypothetical protein